MRVALGILLIVAATVVPWVSDPVRPATGLAVVIGIALGGFVAIATRKQRR